jgi:hypothetical protein
MEPVLVKVYAAFLPANAACLAAVERAGALAIASVNAGAVNTDASRPSWLLLEDGFLRISFEGLHFPVDDVLAALAATLPPHAEGKLDLIDMEAWVITRHQWRSGVFHASRRSLNHVLAHSGH